MVLTAVTKFLLLSKVTSTDEYDSVMICCTDPVNISRNSKHGIEAALTTIIMSDVSVWPCVIIKIGLLPSIIWAVGGFFAFPGTICGHSVAKQA